MTALVVATVSVAGCSPSADGGRGAAGAPSTTVDVTTAPPSPEPFTPLASLGQPAGDALYDPDDHRSWPSPVRLAVDALSLTAPVVTVGLDRQGALDIPGADEVGWYGFGPAPGDRGSAVLAAHIAFDGRDGVFRHLARLTPGSSIVVTFDDGSTTEFVVSELAQYGKDSLPGDLFSTDVPPRLVLITCGGAFNPRVRSYEDNIVVYAAPR